MDIFAHALWTQAVFHEYTWRWWAVLLGFLADALVFGPVMVYGIITGVRGHAVPFFQSWTQLYRVTHSLVIWLVVAALLFLVLRRFWWPLLGWLLHILVDIPTHSKAFFPTPFLWPLSSFTVDGINWSTPWFMVLNYGALAAVYLILYRKPLLNFFRNALKRSGQQ
jgi:hypothetical protein